MEPFPELHPSHSYIAVVQSWPQSSYMYIYCHGMLYWWRTVCPWGPAAAGRRWCMSDCPSRLKPAVMETGLGTQASHVFTGYHQSDSGMWDIQFSFIMYIQRAWEVACEVFIVCNINIQRLESGMWSIIDFLSFQWQDVNSSGTRLAMCCCFIIPSSHRLYRNVQTEEADLLLQSAHSCTAKECTTLQVLLYID